MDDTRRSEVKKKKKIAQALGINIKTDRSAVATDITRKKKGGFAPKFGNDSVAVLQDVVDSSIGVMQLHKE